MGAHGLLCLGQGQRLVSTANSWTPRLLAMRLGLVTYPGLERTQMLPALVSSSYTHLLPVSSRNHSRHY